MQSVKYCRASSVQMSCISRQSLQVQNSMINKLPNINVLSVRCVSRLQAHVTQSSSSQGRLEQQLSERDALLREKDARIESLERKLSDSESHGESLTSRLNEHELVIAGKDRRISELNALIGDRSRSDTTYSSIRHYVWGMFKLPNC